MNYALLDKRTGVKLFLNTALIITVVLTVGYLQTVKTQVWQLTDYAFESLWLLGVALSGILVRPERRVAVSMGKTCALGFAVYALSVGFAAMHMVGASLFLLGLDILLVIIAGTIAISMDRPE